MIKKILVPVDGSEHSRKAIEFAADIANQKDAAVHILHVVKETRIPEGVRDYIRSEGIKESPEAVYLLNVGNHILSAAEAEAKKKGVEQIKHAVIQGDPAEEILNYAKDQDIDMIVLGSRGLGTAKGLMLGSVSSKVCHSADRTCVTVRKDLLDGKRILAVDDEPDVLETLAELLDMCEVVKATSYEEAKTLLNSERFDMAILDIMGVDGYKLLGIAREKEVIPVMLTAHALSVEDTVKSFKKGAASYIPKDEMVNITTYLTDILEAKEKGKHSWWRWLDRFRSYYNGKFTADWQTKIDKEFWEKFDYS
jgi:nucleotide-binding universal stress UspA family protein/CheY-like chemotaxis protein